MKPNAALKIWRHNDLTWLVGCPSGHEYQINRDDYGKRWCIYEETGLGGFIGESLDVHDALNLIIQKEQVNK